MSKFAVIGTYRRAINLWDIIPPLLSSKHEISKILIDQRCKQYPWLWTGNFKQKARNNHVFALNQLDPKMISFYSTEEDLEWQINQLDYDYLITGNGYDLDQHAIRRKLLHSANWIFAEYGWLPWSENTYWQRDGLVHEGTIGKMTDDDLLDLGSGDLRESSLCTEIYEKLCTGTIPTGLPEKFVYLPLQVDATDETKRDFKFKTSQFQSNQTFIDYVRNLTDLPLGIKRHPLGSFPNRMPENSFIIPDNCHKAWLYSNMEAMAAMNSTSILEAMIFDRPLFTYAMDVFSNKSITHQFVDTPQKFQRYLDNYSLDAVRYRTLKNSFLNLLAQQQIERSKFGDKEYINKHYWMNAL